MKLTWRKFKLFGLACCALFGLGLAWLAVANAQANSRLEQKLAAIKAAGEPVTLVDLSRKPIPPETNAATYLNRAEDGVEAINKPMAADFGKDEEDFNNGKPGGKAYQAAKASLLENPRVVPLLERAAACAAYDPQLNFKLAAQEFFASEMLPRIQQKRAAFRVLHYQAMVNLADGQHEAAFVNGLTMLRLARLYESDPLIINQLVVLAVRGVAVLSLNQILRAGPISDEAHQQLEAELSRLDPAKTYHHVLLTERAYGIDEFAGMLNRQLQAGSNLPHGKNLESDYLDLLAILIADGPRPKPSDAAKKILAGSPALEAMFASAVQAVCDANTRSEAQVRALRILNALVRSKQTGDSADLAALALPKDVLEDPYNDQPFTIKKLPEGWLIYAVGNNLKDDGGKVKDYNDVGLAPLREN